MHLRLKKTGRPQGSPLLFALLLLGGCSGGYQRIEPKPSELPERRAVEVYHAGRKEQWHGVRIAADSVSGVPYFQPPSCAECRLVLPLSDVDSMRYGLNNEQQILLGLGIGLVAMVLLGDWLRRNFPAT